MNMEFQKEKWLGSWENFENYIYSEEPLMRETWEQVEVVCQSIPALQRMFGDGSARDFWKTACVTKTEENPVMLGGMEVTAVGTAGAEDAGEAEVNIAFLDRGKKMLGKYAYCVSQIVNRGLEGKENLLLFAKDAPENYPFRYLLAMEPMPDRTARGEKDLLSHFHFQFASEKGKLITEEKLIQPMWYATMCEESNQNVEKCNIVRALHRMPCL